jgi:DNA-binding transcriptional ArsR family regulator
MDVAEIDFSELQENANDAATLLKALSHESRLQVLCHLVDGEKTVSEMQRIIGISQSALSQHLAVLRKDGIVATRRDAQTIFYSLASEAAHALIATLHVHFCGEVAKKKTEN